jgi:molecular chaperone GrpE
MGKRDRHVKKKQAEPEGPADAGAGAARDAEPTAAAPGASGPPSTAADPRDAELERLRAREDELLRALAEFQNVARRRKQEADNAVRYAAEPILQELLPVLDDLERALQAFPSPDDPHRAGVALVQDRLVKILEREGLTAIRPLHEPFDPELHDAIAHLPIPGAAAGTVVEVAVAGYRYGERVLRHAKVDVAAEPPPDADGGSGGRGPADGGGL